MNENVTGLELTCRQIIDFVMAYLDGELPERERAIFDKHLSLCKQCMDYLTTYKETVALAKQSLNDSAVMKSIEPIPVPEDLVRAILASRTKAN